MQDDYINWCIIDALVHIEFFACTRHVWNARLLYHPVFPRSLLVGYFGVLLIAVVGNGTRRIFIPVFLAIVAARIFFAGSMAPCCATGLLPPSGNSCEKPHGKSGNSGGVNGLQQSKCSGVCACAPWSCLPSPGRL